MRAGTAGQTHELTLHLGTRWHSGTVERILNTPMFEVRESSSRERLASRLESQTVRSTTWPRLRLSGELMRRVLYCVAPSQSGELQETTTHSAPGDRTTTTGWRYNTGRSSKYPRTPLECPVDCRFLVANAFRRRRGAARELLDAAAPSSCSTTEAPKVDKTPEIVRLIAATAKLLPTSRVCVCVCVSMSVCVAQFLLPPQCSSRLTAQPRPQEQTCQLASPSRWSPAMTTDSTNS